MPAVLTVADATSFRLWPQELLSSTRCQCHDSDSLAATTTMSSSQLYKALPAGEEGGREINTKPKFVLSQLGLSPPTTQLRHVPALHKPVRAPTISIISFIPLIL